MYGPAASFISTKRLRRLKRKQVRYILWDTLMDGENLKEWFPAYQHPPEQERWMERYFQTHYEQQAFLNGFRILRRRDNFAP